MDELHAHDNLGSTDFNVVDFLSSLGEVTEKDVEDFITQEVQAKLQKIFRKINPEKQIVYVSIAKLNDEAFSRLKSFVEESDPCIPGFHKLKDVFSILHMHTGNKKYAFNSESEK